MFRCNIGLHLYSLMLVLHLLIGSSILRLQPQYLGCNCCLGCFAQTEARYELIWLQISVQSYFRLQKLLGIHLLPLVFFVIDSLLPDLSYIFKELLIMDDYLLSMIFHKLFHVSCVEIWLYKANNTIIILLK